MTTDLTNQFETISKQLELPSYFAMNNDTCLLVRLCTVVAGNALVSEVDKVKGLALNGLFSEKFLMSEVQEEITEDSRLEQSLNVYDELQKGYADINDITSKINDCTDALIGNLQLIRQLPNLFPCLDDELLINEDEKNDIRYRMAEAHCASVASTAIDNLISDSSVSHSSTDLEQHNQDDSYLPSLKLCRDVPEANDKHVDIVENTVELSIKNTLSKFETTVFNLQVENKPLKENLKEKHRTKINTLPTPQKVEPPLLTLHMKPRTKANESGGAATSFNTENIQNYPITLVENKKYTTGGYTDDIKEACLKLFTDDSNAPNIENKNSKTLLPEFTGFKVTKKQSGSCTAKPSFTQVYNKDLKETIAEQKIAMSLFSKSGKDVLESVDCSKKISCCAGTSKVPPILQITETPIQSKLHIGITKKSPKKIELTNDKKRTHSGNKKYPLVIRKPLALPKPSLLKNTIKKPPLTPNKRVPLKNPMLLKDASRFQPKNNKTKSGLQNKHLRLEDPCLAALPLHASCYKPSIKTQQDEALSTTAFDIEPRTKAVSAHMVNSAEVLPNPDIDKIVKTNVGTDPMIDVSVDASQPSKIYVDSYTDARRSIVDHNTNIKPTLITFGTQTIADGTNGTGNHNQRDQYVQHDTNISPNKGIIEAIIPPMKEPMQDFPKVDVVENNKKILSLEHYEHKAQDVRIRTRQNKQKPEVIVPPTKEPMRQFRKNVEKNIPKCHSTGFSLDNFRNEIKDTNTKFQVVKCPVVYEKSRKTERVIVKTAYSGPSKFSEVRPNVASAAIQKLIAEAMTDGVDFSDRRKFVEFREKVVQAKKEGRNASPQRYSYRWPVPVGNLGQGSQCIPLSPLVPSSQKQTHIEIKIPSSRKETRSVNGSTSHRNENDLSSQENIRPFTVDKGVMLKNCFGRNEYVKERTLNYRYNVYNPESSAKTDRSYEYKSRSMYNKNISDSSNFKNVNKESASLENGKKLDDLSGTSNRAISLNPVKNVVPASHFTPSKKDPSEGFLLELSDKLRISHRRYEMQRANMVITRNMNDSHIFKINQNKINEEFPHTRSGYWPNI